MSVVAFTVPGEVRGKGRPRATIRGGHATVYTDAKTASYENRVALVARETMNGAALIEGPVSLKMVAAFQPPASASQKQQRLMLAGDILPTKKPDADNILKVVDALNGIVWRDDKQVVRCVIVKVYRETPGLSITVSEIGRQ